jgi:hypothetical protein
MSLSAQRTPVGLFWGATNIVRRAKTSRGRTEKTQFPGKVIIAMHRSRRHGTGPVYSLDLRVNCAAGENARIRISSIAVRPVMPDAVKIIATTMN